MTRIFFIFADNNNSIDTDNVFFPPWHLIFPPADLSFATASSKQILDNFRASSVFPGQAEAIYQGQEEPGPPAAAQVGAHPRGQPGHDGKQGCWKRSPLPECCCCPLLAKRSTDGIYNGNVKSSFL